jgi:DNA modification methylase
VTVRILIGDVRAKLAELPADSVDCVVTSPPYWGLRDYGVAGQIGMEATLGEHLDVMVEVFDAVRRVMKPEGTLWLNYGDCYATKPNGRSAAATKAQGRDDRTFRDKPFSTAGPICVPDPRDDDRRGSQSTLTGSPPHHTPARILSGGTLKPKDLCMVPNRLAIRLQDAGWWVRSEIIWGKPNPMPDSSGRYRPSTAHEKIFLLTKSAASLYDSEAVRMPAQSGADDWKEPDNWDTTVGEGGHGNVLRVGRAKNAPAPKSVGGPPQSARKRGVGPRHAAHAATNHLTLDNFPRGEGRLLRNFEPDLSAIVPPEVWEIATAAFSEAHFATFPPALASTCILAGCPVGGTVLDPFGGAGTTGLVADRLQRDAILIELNPEYAELARRRINNDAGGLFGEVATEVAA